MVVTHVQQCISQVFCRDGSIAAVVNGRIFNFMKKEKGIVHSHLAAVIQLAVHPLFNGVFFFLAEATAFYVNIIFENKGFIFLVVFYSSTGAY